MAGPNLHSTGDTWSFHCSACGKCCNSAPTLSLPELFYHQRRFVGCLGIRRMRRPRQGPFETTARAYLHGLPGLRDPDSDILLTAQALDVASFGRCPALTKDGHCSIHDDNKPVACMAVPFDPLVPDQLQHLVLAERQIDASFSGAGCIRKGTQANMLPLMHGPTIVDNQAATALAERRRQLLEEKHFWGDAVFRVLEPELFSLPASLAKIPTQGYLTISLTPALMVVAEMSARCRARCIEYLESQLALSDNILLANEVPETRADSGVLAQLRAFAKTSMSLREALRNGHVFRKGVQYSRDESVAIETWLELTPARSRLSRQAIEPIGAEDS